jgi:hypothetical protein
MGNPIYSKNYDFKNILERGLSNGNLFVEQITEGNKSIYCIFSTINNCDYIFWKQKKDGDITLCLEIDKRSHVLQYISGSITKIGKFMCNSAIRDISLLEYLNTTDLIF